MELSEVCKNLYHTLYPTKHELASTYLRFQEHYESPEFKGKIFTLEQYIEWYMKHSEQAKSEGRFTFYDEWDGFNIPSKVLEPFYQGRFDPLTEQESGFLKSFADKQNDDFYIIGTCTTTPHETFLHEVAHGLFAMDKKYRKEALRILKELKPELKDKIHRYLDKQAAYSPDVYVDETQAYLAAMTDLRDDAKIPIEELQEPHCKLSWLLHRHYKGIK